LTYLRRRAPDDPGKSRDTIVGLAEKPGYSVGFVVVYTRRTPCTLLRESVVKLYYLYLLI
jgi:hypothetical protein